MFGYRADEMLGKAVTMLLPEAARAGDPASVEAFGAGPKASRMMSERPEIQGLRRSGEAFPIEAAIAKVDVGDALTYTALLRDVTERNRARAKLEESERRIRAVFDNAAEAIALLTPDGVVVEINRVGEALTAVDRPLTGAALWDAPWLGLDLGAGAEATERLRAAIATAAAGQPARMAAELTRNGTSLPIDVRLTPVADGAGRVTYVLAEGRFES